MSHIEGSKRKGKWEEKYQAKTQYHDELLKIQEAEERLKDKVKESPCNS